MPTPLRNIRVPDEVWHPAMATAKAAGRSLTEVLVEFLRTYSTTPAPTARTHRPQPARPVSDLHGWDPGPNGRCLHKVNGIVCNMPKRHVNHQ